MIDAFADEADFIAFWLNPQETGAESLEFLVNAGVDTTCLIDAAGEVYNGYALQEFGQAWAPFPMNVVVDREGIITYMANDSDPDAARAAIEAALAQ